MTLGRTLDAFAVTAPGLAALAARELTAMGIAPSATEAAGVSFSANAAQLAAGQLGLRTVSRVLVRMATFRATAFHELERAARQVEWGEVLPAGTPFTLRVTCRKSRLYHSDAVAERVAGAIVRAIPGSSWQRGADASDDADEATPTSDAPAQLFVVRFDRDRCTISADASGALLHRRGYRLAVGRAPLRETLAAGMLLGAEYDPARPLIDPMCGSGTIAIEAAMIARRIAPGLHRAFAAERWPCLDASVWGAARDAASAAMLPAAPAPIFASDRDAGAIEAAQANAGRAGVAGDISFREAPLSALEAPPGPGLLIANPPYGVRVGETKPLRDLFARLGQVA
ncbi:MAG: THUMP domain-containing class I SAM-dependent RNA methyltransferase, partial [Gemmatimonadaceae bacterium]